MTKKDEKANNDKKNIKLKIERHELTGGTHKMTKRFVFNYIDFVFEA